MIHKGITSRKGTASSADAVFFFEKFRFLFCLMAFLKEAVDPAFPVFKSAAGAQKGVNLISRDKREGKHLPLKGLQDPLIRQGKTPDPFKAPVTVR